MLSGRKGSTRECWWIFEASSRSDQSLCLLQNATFSLRVRSPGVVSKKIPTDFKDPILLYSL